MLAPVVVKRVSPADVMSGGLVLATIGFVMLTQVGADSDVALLVASTVVFSLGLAPLFTLTNDLIIGSAPPERAGAASGISETGAELGGAFAIALLGTLGTAVYRNRLDEELPAGSPTRTSRLPARRSVVRSPSQTSFLRDLQTSFSRPRKPRSPSAFK